MSRRDRIVSTSRGMRRRPFAEIAERAELTKRTFFRYFSDKREVAVQRSQELQRLWLEGLAAAPARRVRSRRDSRSRSVAEMFIERHPFARIRAQVIEANPSFRNVN